MEAARYIDRLKTSRQNNSLQYILEKDNSPSSKEHLKSLKTAAENRIDILKKKLLEKYRSYVQPSIGLREQISAYEQAKIQANIAERKQEALTSANPNVTVHPILMDLNYVVPDLSEPFVKLEGAYFAINFHNGIVQTEPLLHPDGELFHEIEKEILVLSKTSHHVNVLDTLDRIIDRAKSKGLSRDNMNTLIKDFVHAYIPQLSGSITNRSTPDLIFESVLASVNFTTIANQIRSAINKLSRAPGQSIDHIFHSYISLLLELAYIEQPTMSTSAAAKKASKEAIRNLKYFLEKNMAKELDELRRMKLMNLDEELTADEVLEFITMTECNPIYQLKSVKSMADTNISVSIFQTEFQQSRANYANLEKESPYYSPVAETRPNSPSLQIHANTKTAVTYPRSASPIQHKGLRTGRPPKRDVLPPTRYEKPSPRSPSASRSQSPRRGSSRTPRQSRSPSLNRNRNSRGVWIRSRSGNTMNRVSRDRIRGRTTSRSLSGKRSYNRTKSPSTVPPNRFSCKLCGALNSHETPNVGNKSVCPVYPGQKFPQKSVCQNCNQGLYHKFIDCLHGPPIKNRNPSKSPSRETTKN